MTQEEKKILIQDLSSRLPHGVILNCCGNIAEKLTLLSDKGLVNNDYDIEEVKPYLLPLSSITKEQLKESSWELDFYGYKIDKDGVIESGPDINTTFIPIEYITPFINWCYKNHFDINGLIPKGIALDATGMDIYKNI